MKQRAELHARDAGLVGHIGEGAIAVVVIENVAPELRDVEIGKAVVVVVAPDAPQAVAGAGNAGLFGDVGEGAVAVVAIERVANGNAAVVEIASVHEVNVLPAVAVEVCHAHARPEFFAVDGDALVALEMGELDSGTARSVSVNWMDLLDLSAQGWMEQQRKKRLAPNGFPNFARLPQPMQTQLNAEWKK